MNLKPLDFPNVSCAYSSRKAPLVALQYSLSYLLIKLGQSHFQNKGLKKDNEHL